jgi:hypothetical protein
LKIYIQYSGLFTYPECFSILATLLLELPF